MEIEQHNKDHAKYYLDFNFIELPQNYIQETPSVPTSSSAPNKDRLSVRKVISMQMRNQPE